MSKADLFYGNNICLYYVLMLNCKINGTIHLFFLKSHISAPGDLNSAIFSLQYDFTHYNISMSFFWPHLCLFGCPRPKSLKMTKIAPLSPLSVWVTGAEIWLFLREKNMDRSNDRAVQHNAFHELVISQLWRKLSCLFLNIFAQFPHISCRFCLDVPLPVFTFHVKVTFSQLMFLCFLAPLLLLVHLVLLPMSIWVFFGQPAISFTSIFELRLLNWEENHEEKYKHRLSARWSHASFVSINNKFFLVSLTSSRLPWRTIEISIDFHLAAKW